MSLQNCPQQGEKDFLELPQEQLVWEVFSAAWTFLSNEQCPSLGIHQAFKPWVAGRRYTSDLLN